MKKINILTTTPLSAVLIATLLIFSDGILVVKGYNVDKIASGCRKNTDGTGETRSQALMSIDSAIRFVGYKLPNRCACANGSKVFAAANCSALLTPKGCQRCLYNAQYRVVDTECPYAIGGWLALKDCYVRFDTGTRFCHGY
ncbi:unnamed protein product [Linum trigynum]|uniref:Gnk2-homologous domain-containing protein n=1 Tax=Linum trigynum TaxID=586398 RepID=A0AAV2E2K0_9ROSI